MKTQRVRNSTKRNYYSVWKSFNQFFIKLDHKTNNWEDRLILFIAYLIEEKNFRSQSVHSYVLTIRGVLSEDSVSLNEDKLLLSALTNACKRKNDRVRMRLPLKKDMLGMIIRCTRDYFMQNSQPYLAKLYGALFSTAYFGMFRISELTSGEHPVKVTDVKLADNKRKLKFILRTSKMHGLKKYPQLIKISSTQVDESLIANTSKGGRSVGLTFCPYKILRDYTLVRPLYKTPNEPFFVFSDWTPVKPHHMRKILKRMISHAGFDQRFYNSHSLRSGRSVDLLKLGVSINFIKFFGQWHSNAVFSYLTQH